MISLGAGGGTGPRGPPAYWAAKTAKKSKIGRLAAHGGPEKPVFFGAHRTHEKVGSAVGHFQTKKPFFGRRFGIGETHFSFEGNQPAMTPFFGPPTLTWGT